MRPLNAPRRVLTWHVHGSYLRYLAHSRHTFYLPVKPGRPEGYGGRAGNAWPDNLVDVAADEVGKLDLDCVLFQSRRNWEQDQFEILSPAQRRLPRIFLEHDPPREVPTDTRHPVDDPDVLLVHVTHFNDLMWDSGRTPTKVIDHGVMVPPDAGYSGERDRGVVVVNGLARRGRRLGADVFARARAHVPLELYGMDAQALGGQGELPHDDLLRAMGRYRFFFHPIRYTSLGLAVCEAMLLGMPVVGLATTELVTVVDDGVNGFVDTDVERLIERMCALVDDRALAAKLGAAARETAQERFTVERFARNWDNTIDDVTGAWRGKGAIGAEEEA